MLKFLFHKSSIALLGSLFFLWGSIGLFHDTNLENEDLIEHSGRVVHIDSIRTIHGRTAGLAGKKSFLLRIVLDSEPNTFFSATPLKKYGQFDFITSRVSVGDQITIFTKPRLWKIFGLKRANDISRLIKEKETVISYDRFKKKVRGLSLFTSAASIFFFFAYIWITIKRIKNQNA